jgi:hypothetical protein
MVVEEVIGVVKDYMESYWAEVVKMYPVCQQVQIDWRGRMETTSLIAVLAAVVVVVVVVAVVKLYSEYLVRIDWKGRMEMTSLIVMVVVEDLVVDWSVLDFCWMAVDLQEVVLLVEAVEVVVVVVVVRTKVVDLM